VSLSAGRQRRPASDAPARQSSQVSAASADRAGSVGEDPLPEAGVSLSAGRQRRAASGAPARQSSQVSAACGNGEGLRLVAPFPEARACLAAGRQRRAASDAPARQSSLVSAACGRSAGRGAPCPEARERLAAGRGRWHGIGCTCEEVDPQGLRARAAAATARGSRLAASLPEARAWSAPAVGSGGPGGCA
jgi:hypothetical protein